MLELFSKENRRKIAILQNAFNISEVKKLNSINELTFSLPYDDYKNQFCKAFEYVRLDGGDLYRILNDGVRKAETGAFEYRCEHVIAKLLDTVLFGFHSVGNLGVYTKDCINFLLSKQKDWVLDECDFKHQFEYGFEQENIYSALFSIPKPFTEPYIWTFDTKNYPWKLSLKKLEISNKPDLYIRNAHNLLDISNDINRNSLCTRLYPLGYGEGVNQLNISAVNGNLMYIQSPKEIVDKYGIIERVWIDRRYENAETLFSAAQSMLKELQEPIECYEVDFADLEQNKNISVGETVKIIDTELNIQKSMLVTEINSSFNEFDIFSAKITLSNKSANIASTVADLADRQRIEQTYSQGATQIYSQSLQENSDSLKGVIMDFIIPNEMRIINKVLCKVRMESFRAYSQITSSTATTRSTSSSGGGLSTSTKDGGGVYTSTEYDGGVSTSTENGGSETLTSGSGGGENITSNNGGSFSETSEGLLNISSYETGSSDGSEGYHTHSTRVGTHSHYVKHSGHSHTVKIPNHSHSVKVPSHSHDFEVPNHFHSVEIDAHFHDFDIPNHSHTLEIPGHNHDITAGIFRFGNPKTMTLFVNGIKKAVFSSTSQEIDLTPYLIDANSGKINRGLWQNIEIRPNDLAYITITLTVQGFVQSRGDYSV